MESIFYIIVSCGVLALIYSAVAARQIMSASAGSAKMQEIAAAIQEGAQAYLSRQYKTIAIVGVGVTILLYLLLGGHVALGFIIGATLSGIAG